MWGGVGGKVTIVSFFRSQARNDRIKDERMQKCNPVSCSSIIHTDLIGLSRIESETRKK